MDRDKLQRWTAAHGTPQQVALRCRIVLAASAGDSDVTIAKRLSVNRNTVVLWRKRFGDEGLDGLFAPGRGRKPTFATDKIAAIVDATLQTKPAGMTHWSCRTMAQNQGVSKSTVKNIWRAHNIQPHRTKTFKLSRDPKFLEKMTDVIAVPRNQSFHNSLGQTSQNPPSAGWFPPTSTPFSPVLGVGYFNRALPGRSAPRQFRAEGRPTSAMGSYSRTTPTFTRCL